MWMSSAEAMPGAVLLCQELLRAERTDGLEINTAPAIEVAVLDSNTESSSTRDPSTRYAAPPTPLPETLSWEQDDFPLIAALPPNEVWLTVRSKELNATAPPFSALHCWNRELVMSALLWGHGRSDRRGWQKPRMAPPGPVVVIKSEKLEDETWSCTGLPYSDCKATTPPAKACW